MAEDHGAPEAGRLPWAVFARFRFLAGETGPGEESKRTKRVQGWSRQILGFYLQHCDRLVVL